MFAEPAGDADDALRTVMSSRLPDLEDTIPVSRVAASAVEESHGVDDPMPSCDTAAPHDLPRASELPRAAERLSRVNDDATVVLEGDAFTAAAQAFGFDADADSETATGAARETGAARQTVTAAPAAATSAASTPAASRRPRVLRNILAGGASVGVMGVACLLTVSMTLPAGAVAAAQGPGAQTVTSLVAPQKEGTGANAVDEDEIQAFVASSDVQTEQLARSENYSTVSLAEVAAQEGINYSTDVFTNDPDAAIQWPFIVGTSMSYGYGMRDGRLHEGIDFTPGSGAPIQAIADGTVRTATESDGAYGVSVYIDHVIDGQVITSHYAHMQYGSLRVQAGDKVKVGDTVGLVGNTGRSFGAHLHFELIVNGSTIDPMPWLKENAGRYDGVAPVS
ncbi:MULTISPECIES: M23 family metallopeptidase [Microbacterium]|uniref:M23 family metallopeptidase n=1 Tax=Microbacterium TaxID=33882 RepID=UPI00217D056F|nr:MULTISPECIES: M23 family metallopeptidase [Microbacterium]UWF77870.1 M23 family metallopeptidase [Microbacterium neungamense]WCM56046.1 M23 family metallopeptidase [Microbacterium sp. EF45047]